MTQERIDLTKIETFLESAGQESGGRFVYDLIAELKRCYEKIDWLQQAADLAADNVGRKNWDGFEEAMYEAGLWERPSE